MAPPPNTPSTSTATPFILSAKYRAPTCPSPTESTTTPTSAGPPTHTFSHPLPSSLSLHHAPQSTVGTGSGTDTPTVRAAYLSDLRSAVVRMQGEMNVFLTARMEEDARVAGAGAGAGKKVDEEREEENYGEEEGGEDE